MSLKLLCAILFISSIGGILAFGEDTDSLAKQDAKRRETIKYGTDAELISLITALENEKNATMDGDLLNALNGSTGTKFIDAIFAYLTRGKKKGGEDKALRLLENRDKESNSNIDSSIQYLACVKEKKAGVYFTAILDSEDSRFSNAAARALGACGGEEDADFLIKFVKERNPSDALNGDIIYALGELKSNHATGFLTDILMNAEAKAFKKILAIEALGKIKDTAAIEQLLSSQKDADANVRAYATASLASFSDEKSGQAIIECFRDSFYKVRIAAAKAAAERKLDAAIPFLKYRAEHDEVAAVKEESISALGAIGSTQALEILGAFFSDKNTADRLRIAAAKAMMEREPDLNASNLIAAIDQARADKKMQLYHGLSKIVSSTKSSKLEEYARILLASTDLSDKIYGIDLFIANGYESLKELIRPLEKDANASIARKARQALGD